MAPAITTEKPKWPTVKIEKNGTRSGADRFPRSKKHWSPQGKSTKIPPSRVIGAVLLNEYGQQRMNSRSSTVRPYTEAVFALAREADDFDRRSGFPNARGGCRGAVCAAAA